MRRLVLLTVPMLLLGCELVLGAGDRRKGTGGTTSSTSESASNGTSTSSTMSATTSVSTTGSGCGNTMFDINNCGTCGNVCGPGHGTAMCGGGTCVFMCSTNYAHCSTSLDKDGCDVALLTDNNHCGDCMTMCTGTHCSGGTCCPTGLDNCDDGAGCHSLATDKKNCGACGHDCLGGDCVNGQCQPLIISQNEGYPSSLALDKDHVYWTNHNTNEVKSLPKTTVGATAPNLVTSISTPDNIFGAVTDGTATTNASTVYFILYGNSTTPTQGAYSAPASGGSPTPIPNGNTFGSSALAFGGGKLFWSFRNGQGTTVVSRYDVTANTVDSLSTAPPNFAATAAGIVADGSIVYWADTGLGEIFSAPIGGAQCDETTTNGCHLVRAATHPDAIAEDANNIYWAEGMGSFSIYEMSKTNGNPILVATTTPGSTAFVRSLASDGTNLYWTDFGDMSVRTAPVNVTMACTPTGALACRYLDGPYTGYPAFPSAVAVDDKAIYWAYQRDSISTSPSGLIKRLAK
jgi:hypothetical protein